MPINTQKYGHRGNVHILDEDVDDYADVSSLRRHRFRVISNFSLKEAA
jgi:hypothetical protein